MAQLRRTFMTTVSTIADVLVWKLDLATVRNCIHARRSPFPVLRKAVVTSDEQRCRRCSCGSPRHRMPAAVTHWPAVPGTRPSTHRPCDLLRQSRRAGSPGFQDVGRRFDRGGRGIEDQELVARRDPEVVPGERHGLRSKPKMPPRAITRSAISPRYERITMSSMPPSSSPRGPTTAPPPTDPKERKGRRPLRAC